jgi:hypothetical protein
MYEKLVQKHDWVSESLGNLDADALLLVKWILKNRIWSRFIQLVTGTMGVVQKLTSPVVWASPF